MILQSLPCIEYAVIGSPYAILKHKLYSGSRDGTVFRLLIVGHSVAPLVAAAVMARRGRRQRDAMMAGAILLGLALAMGFGTTVAYSLWVRGGVRVGQVLITSYAVLCMVYLPVGA